MRTYAFVIARGDRKDKKDKSNFILDGEKLYIKLLNTLLKCKEIDKIILDTNSEEMYEAVDYMPIEFLKRNNDLAADDVSSVDLLLNEVSLYPDADIYLQISPTFPFITSETIDNAVKELKDNTEFDSLLLMKKEKLYRWMDKQPLYVKGTIKANLEETVSETMGFSIIRKEVAVNLKDKIGLNPKFFYASNIETVECNNLNDLEFANIIAHGIKQKEIANFRLMRHFITSALISDILDDLEIKYQKKCGGIINGFICNIKDCKLLGRASTLRLRQLDEGEDFNGIYDALQSYNYIGENDIICVENELNDFAYFGDLNARLAIRAGAQGTIIDGATRDKNATKMLDYPVFAKSYNSQDVRRRATLDYINKPIKFNETIIHPKDLIFIDDCAMAVIYKEFESEVLKMLYDTFLNEKNIVNAILKDKNASEIINEYGAF